MHVCEAEEKVSAVMSAAFAAVVMPYEPAKHDNWPGGDSLCSAGHCGEQKDMCGMGPVDTSSPFTVHVVDAVSYC